MITNNKKNIYNNKIKLIEWVIYFQKFYGTIRPVKHSEMRFTGETTWIVVNTTKNETERAISLKKNRASSGYDRITNVQYFSNLNSEINVIWCRLVMEIRKLIEKIIAPSKVLMSGEEV